MHTYSVILGIIFIACHLMHGQGLDVEGPIKFSELDTMNAANWVVVRAVDGTLGVRETESLITVS